MPRPRPPSAPSIANLAARRAPLLSVELAVVTPLFGGGAIPRQADPLMPVRGASVRGQLRFWWRVCKARQYEDTASLFRAESAIWGQAGGETGGGPSEVDVNVQNVDTGVFVPCRVPRRNGQGVEWNPNYPSYALFPFQEQRGRRGSPETPAAMGLEGVRFRLALTCAPHVTPDREDALRENVEASVWAWVTFGGIGARTRRGCGSLHCDDDRFRPSGNGQREWYAWLRAGLERHVARGTGQHPIPMLAAGLVLDGRAAGPIPAWRKAVAAMQQFRQQPPFARNPGRAGRPGRSRWPEADTLRQVIPIPDPGHPPQHPARPYYPRADLGLPIIFQQMDRSSDPTLAAGGDGATRMASPIVVKALALASDRAVPMALLLSAPHVWEVSAGVTLNGRRVPPDDLHDAERSENVEPLLGKSTAREAFMAYVQKEWNEGGVGR